MTSCALCPRPAVGVRTSRVRIGLEVVEVETPVCALHGKRWRFERRMRAAGVRAR